MRLLRCTLCLAATVLLLGAEGCFYKATSTDPRSENYRPYYEGVNVASPWYGYPYGPAGWYPSPVHLGGARLGGRY